MALAATFIFLGHTSVFNSIEVKFFNEKVRRSVEKDMDMLSLSIDNYHKNNEERFLKILDEDSLRKSFLPNMSAQDVFSRTKAIGLLQESTPGLTTVRIIDSNGTRIHYSTLPSDILRSENQKIIYRNYDDASDEPYSEIMAVDGRDALIKPLSRQRVFAYSFPFVDNFDVYRGSIVFYVSFSGLLSNLIENGLITLGDDIVTVGQKGILFGSPSWAGKDFINHIDELWLIGPNAEPFSIGATEASDNFVLFSRSGMAGFVGRLIPSGWFKMPSAFQWLLTVTFFASIFLLIFLLFNIKQDKLALLAARIKRLQIEMLDEYLDRKGELDFEYWKSELESRRNEAKTRIRKSAGAIAKRRPADVDALIDKSWDDIIAVLTAQSHKPSKAVDLASIEALLREALSKGNFVVQASSLPPGKKHPVSSEKLSGTAKIEAPAEAEELEAAEEVAELEEAEELEAAEEVAELEEAEELEAAEEVAELEEAEELEAAEEVAELEEAEEPEAAEEVAELEEAEELEATEEVADLEEAEELEAVEEVAELEEAEELEAVEEVAELEEAEELEAVEEVAELEEAEELEAGEEVAELEEAEELEAAEEVAELEEAEELEAAEEVAELEEAEELEAAEEVAELEEAEEPEAAEEVAELEEAEELEAAEEVTETVLAGTAKLIHLPNPDEDDIPVIPEGLGLELVEEDDLTDVLTFLDVTSSYKQEEVSDYIELEALPENYQQEAPIRNIVLASPMESSLAVLKNDELGSIDFQFKDILADMEDKERLEFLEEVEFEIFLDALDLSGLEGYTDEEGFLELEDSNFMAGPVVQSPEVEEPDIFEDEIRMLSTEQQEKLEKLYGPEKQDENIYELLPVMEEQGTWHKYGYYKRKEFNRNLEELQVLEELEEQEAAPLEEIQEESIVTVNGIYKINKEALDSTLVADESLKELADSVLGFDKP
ncbi:hypothetical protein MASR2M29_11600 [Spirochaetota bacterium]